MSAAAATAVVVVGSNDDDLKLVRICQGYNEDDDTSWVTQAESLLRHQWPRGEPYRERLIHSYHASEEYYGLPCSYLLIDKTTGCIGYEQKNCDLFDVCCVHRQYQRPL
jgi:hypothetical protein